MDRRAGVALCTLASAMVVALCVGCDAGGGAPVDPDDAGQPGQDADSGGSPTTGVSVEFRYLGADGQPVPVDSGDIVFPTFTIEQMTMQLHKVELIGDSADHLEAESHVLEYPWSSPPRITFPSAPSGLYSRFRYDVERTDIDEMPPGFEGERLSIRVRGQALVEPNPRAFEYVDDEKVKIDLGFRQEVDPNGTIVVDLELARWFDVVEWQALADQMDEDDDDDGGEDGSDGEDGGDEDGDDGGGPGNGDGGPGNSDGGNSGPGNGNGNGGTIWIGLEGDGPTAGRMRERMKGSFKVPVP